jgi:tetratricopeptide (TPR) repeat protein
MNTTRLFATATLALSINASPVWAQAGATRTSNGEVRPSHPEAERAFREGRRAQLETRFDDAAKELEKALALEPTSSLYALWLGRAYARQAQKASLFKQPGLAKKTRNTFQRAVDLDPDNLEARESLVEFYLQAPGIVGGSVSKANAEAAEIGKRNPTRGAIARGRILEKNKQYAEAEQLYRSGLANERKSATVRLGSLYQSQSDWEKMFTLFEETLRKDPAETWPLYHVGKTSALSGQRLERGEQALLAYVKTTPEEGDAPVAGAYWRLGAIYEAKKEPAKARAAYETALKLNPRHAESAAALKKLK